MRREMTLQGDRGEAMKGLEIARHFDVGDFNRFKNSIFILV
jgi:hypothetical protein